MDLLLLLILTQSCCTVWKKKRPLGNPAQIQMILSSGFGIIWWFHVHNMFFFGNVHFIPRSRQIFLCRRGTAIKYGWTANGWIQGQCDAQKEKRWVCFCWLQISHRLKGVKYNFILLFGKQLPFRLFFAWVETTNSHIDTIHDDSWGFYMVVQDLCHPQFQCVNDEMVIKQMPPCKTSMTPSIVR